MKSMRSNFWFSYKLLRTSTLGLLFLTVSMVFPACSVIETTYDIITGTVKGTVWVIKGTYELTKGTTKLVYHIGNFTFEVIRAPLDWPLTH